MISQAAHAKLGELAELLHDCGWSVARCEKFSAETINNMIAIDEGANRDRKAIEAAKLLPTLGPDVTAERLGVSRRNVYYLASDGNKDSARFSRMACTK